MISEKRQFMGKRLSTNSRAQYLGYILFASFTQTARGSHKSINRQMRMKATISESSRKFEAINCPPSLAWLNYLLVSIQTFEKSSAFLS
jgi:hypothetical protein